MASQYNPMIPTVGYLYVFINDCMPGLLKIGMTERTPRERLADANKSNTWIPEPFKLVLYKRVNNPHAEEYKIHKFNSILNLR